MGNILGGVSCNAGAYRSIESVERQQLSLLLGDPVSGELRVCMFVPLHWQRHATWLP